MANKIYCNVHETCLKNHYFGITIEFGIYATILYVCYSPILDVVMALG